MFAATVTQANTACGIETNMTSVITEIVQVTQANTACGIETKPFLLNSPPYPVTQANTACGIETHYVVWSGKLALHRRIPLAVLKLF